MRKPIAIHKAIIARCEEDAQYGNATHMREFVSALRAEYGAETVKFAVRGLADGRVGAVRSIALRHVGRGFYELVDVSAAQ